MSGLKDANTNPWYVLATIHGEQDEDWDEELKAKNRQAWNGWVFSNLTIEKQNSFGEDYNLSLDHLKALADVDLNMIQATFKTRLPDTKLPELTEPCNFTKIHFDRLTNFEEYVFVNFVDFSSARFSKYVIFRSTKFNEGADFSSASFIGRADFWSATFIEGASFSLMSFRGDADFSFVTFSEYADFNSTSFGKDVSFHSATFSDDVLFVSAKFDGHSTFRSATFGRPAHFRFAKFNGAAVFNSAKFSGPAKFNSSEFKANTIFDGVVFNKAVPEFHAAVLYDDTTFTLPDDFRENWPPLEGENVMPAADQKRAYNRLRLFMNQTLQVEEEQFFHRQEMRCKMVDAKGYHKPIYKMFELLSDFGGSVMRPLLGLMAVVCFGAVMMSFYKVEPDVGVLSNAWGWSIANTFPFLGFGKLYYGGGYALALPIWLKIIGGFQTVFGFILLFLLGLGLRNRFRLR